MESYPLHWPVGYKRNTNRISSRFKTSMYAARKFLQEELRRMNATSLVVSTNLPTRNDGMLYADWMRRKIDDPGVAIYFKYKGKDISMCCDKYLTVWENIMALGKGIEALRGMDRWGVSDFIDRAFTGFTALPETSSAKLWYQILEVPANATESEVKESFRKKAMIHHPDKGGSLNQFIIIQGAYNEGMKQFN